VDREVVETARWLAEHTTGRFRRKLLNQVVWYATESEGKYTTRFRSREALRLQAELGRTEAARHLAHEHVVPRQLLIDRLIAEPGRAPEILAFAVACVVTREEHSRLPDGDGWERYEAAGIEVVDTRTPG
jgi:hypothetical protein